ncbi:ABC transporter permease [Streptomyces sp. CBMA29]|uniref:ABC transporter permease n=1 Tax=Streptomyces sp. CBMA29 TaxID=1896314 RepID=UPI001661B567|nr:ABC transporter permease [Streptomyces sp. CBMA29]MBD0739040.1 ABC transporter permease [Streptomyces sp. CBMA29]
MSAPAAAAASPPRPGRRPPRSRLLGRDLLRLGTVGLRTRPARAILSALGIAIGIAAMIAVVGISASSQAKLNAQLAQLGTNLLTAQAGKSLFGQDTKLPQDTIAKVGLLDGVESTSGYGDLDVSVYRSHLSDKDATGGITARAADLRLLDTVGARLAAGSWLNAATAKFPAVVLGSKTAERLGVVTPGSQVWLGGRYFTVVGILEAVPLAPELDTSALVGTPVARSQFGYDGSPTVVYERSADAAVDSVRSRLGRTVNPRAPDEVTVSRPSDALAAKNAADQAFTGLLVGLGSVALLVGGIGVANTMIISVLERRREIGLRRALGATRRHIRAQFLAEALLLSALGGVLGSALGVAVTAGFAVIKDWPLSVPPVTLLIAVGATLFIGAVAGLYPAIRAARTHPTAALSG